MTAAFLLSPLFLLLDFVLDANLRAPGLAALGVGWGGRTAFYLAITALGVMALWLPQLAAAIGSVETGATIAIACLVVCLPYLELLERAESGGELTMPEFPLEGLLVTAVVTTVSLAAIRSKGLLPMFGGATRGP